MEKPISTEMMECAREAADAMADARDKRRAAEIESERPDMYAAG